MVPDNWVEEAMRVLRTIICFYYPDICIRPLEEVGLIPTTAQELPFLSDDEVGAKAKEYGVVSDGASGGSGNGNEKVDHTGKELENRCVN